MSIEFNHSDVDQGIPLLESSTMYQRNGVHRKLAMKTKVGELGSNCEIQFASSPSLLFPKAVIKTQVEIKLEAKLMEKHYHSLSESVKDVIESLNISPTHSYGSFNGLNHNPEWKNKSCR